MSVLNLNSGRSMFPGHLTKQFLNILIRVDMGYKLDSCWKLIVKKCRFKNKNPYILAVCRQQTRL